MPDTITTRSRHTVTDQGGAPRPSSSLRSCSPSAVTGQTLSTRGAATDATHGRAVAHGCVHRSTSLGCLRLCRTRKSLNLAFCFDQLSSGETAACIESHRPLSVAKAIRRSNRARYRPIIQLATRPHITRTTYARPCARLPLVVLTCGITVGFQGFVRIRQPYIAMHQFHTELRSLCCVRHIAEPISACRGVH